MLRILGTHLKKSIRRRIIINKDNSCIKKQMRLTNAMYIHEKTSRFVYRIEYINDKIWSEHLIFQK